MNQIEKVARALCAADPEIRRGDAEHIVQQLVNTEWRNYTDAAKAAIAAMQPAPQEPVDSAAEITRLTEALRAAEEREKALLSALEEWMFRYFWRVDGMPVEAARIHAQSRMKIAALAGAKP